MSLEYWEKRSHLAYYQRVRSLIEELSPAESILDVGCADTPIALFGDFKERYTIDLHHDPELKGVTSFIDDFTLWVPPRSKFSVVTCLQTIEHLKDNELPFFTAALFDVSESLIITLPWKWPRSATKTHYQDPIDEEKLSTIIGREPVQQEIVKDGKRERIVLLFRGH